MLDKIKRDMVPLLARVRIRTEEEAQAMEAAERQRLEAQARRMQFQHPETGGLGADDEAAEFAGAGHAGAQGQDMTKVGRNDPCPCGSGKKFKHCHGQLA
jgi:preprotein translocase subunit SecA